MVQRFTGVVAPIRAVTTVLKTAEILERILLQLEPRQIFTVQQRAIGVEGWFKVDLEGMWMLPEGTAVTTEYDRKRMA
nr:hypothetical protein B0A51_06157 [Rachicladosporium sp. CCFEE 5018]